MMKDARPLSEDEAIRQALRLRDAGHHAQALDIAAAALKRWPRNAKLYQTKALIHRAVGDSGPAMDALATAAKLAPTDARIAHALARVTMEAGKPAVDLFLKARKLAPQDGSVVMGLAAARLAEGKAEDGIAELDAVLRQNPGWLDGHEAISNLRWIAGYADDFVASYEAALAGQPADLALWAALLSRLIFVNRYDALEPYLARARKACGHHQQFDMCEAIIASETGKHAVADQLFEWMRSVQDVHLAVRHVRHLLRTGRAVEAVDVGLPFLSQASANHVWPYMATAWRILDDPRWAWLEDHQSLTRFVQVLDDGEVEQLARYLRPLHQDSGPPVGQSMRGGTQTDGPLFARVDPIIVALKARIAEAVGQHLSNLGPFDEAHPVLRYRPGPVRFAGSWSVRLSSAGFHVNHVHPQGWFSSALYVVVPPAESAGAPPAGWLSLGQPPAELGIDLPPIRMFEPKPGYLALFPSIMWHGTIPFDGGERMTVAFDVAYPPK